MPESNQGRRESTRLAGYEELNVQKQLLTFEPRSGGVESQRPTAFV